MAVALLAPQSGMTAKKGGAPGGAKPKLPIVNQISAGGVVYQRTGDYTVVAIVSVGNAGRWQLPKGLIEKGESAEDAAVRETKEEAGITGAVEAPLESVEYWYVGPHEGKRVRFHKLVHFFLLGYKSGDVSGHDSEVNEARWVPIAEAAEMLAFESERKVLAKAAELL